MSKTTYTVRDQIISIAAIKLRKAASERTLSDPRNSAHEVVEGIASRNPDGQAYLDDLGWEGRSYEQMLGRILSKAGLG